LSEIDRALGTPDEQSVWVRVWESVDQETTDYGIMEHAREIAVISASMDWNDIGSWQTLMELLAPDSDGSVLTGDHIALDTRNTLIYSPKKLVAAIGLQDLVIVETEDALLICPRDRSQDVRRIVAALRERSQQDLL
jgi:mannose-1-phosphate guanylyltransferase